MAEDTYKTIQQIAEGYYTEKRSRFVSYAIP
ncbi:MAG: YigZ family protein, partial [Tannerellaceae bacterium]|nr:YigZ family protein [Tannerellaceae bacterium]